MRVQFASDMDGDLWMFPRDLHERVEGWNVDVVMEDGTRRRATVGRTLWCVTEDGQVSNVFGCAEPREVEGFFVDTFVENPVGIEITVEGETASVPHPRARATNA